MPFRPVAPSKEVDTSSVAGLGKSVLDIAQWAYVQFNAVASAFQASEPMKIWHSPPPKPREGTIVYADGTNWNGGPDYPYGEGPYYCNSAGQWAPMSSYQLANLPWTTYVPGVSVSAGALGGGVVASGRFKLLSKICFVNVSLTIPNIGSATGYPSVSLPVAPPVLSYLYGRENAINGKTLIGIVASASAQIVNYDNSSPLVNGVTLILCGSYEIS